MTASFAKLLFDFDYKKLAQSLDDLATKALPSAGASFLNGIAVDAQDRMKSGLDKDFDRPNNFTKNAFGIKFAQRTDAEKMFAQVHVKDMQAEYIAFQIFGGKRQRGDAGAGPYDVQAFATKLTNFGGVDRKFLRTLSDRNRKEKADRAALRTQRDAARVTRQSAAARVKSVSARMKALAGQKKATAERKSIRADLRAATKAERQSIRALKALAWVKKSRNKAGIFFGEVDGVKGYWTRPERTKASTPRQKGIVSVRPSGNNRPQLQMMMKDEVHYERLYRYDWYVRESVRVKGTAQHWLKALAQTGS